LLLFQLDVCILGFEHLNSLNTDDEGFGELYSNCEKHLKGYFQSKKSNCSNILVCVFSNVAPIKLLIREIHGRSSAGYYGQNKALTILREHFF